MGCFVMEAFLAKNAGFCSGVKRAFQMAEDSLSEDRSWYSLGPLVHNDLVIDYFEKKGLKKVEKLDDIDENNCGVVIRSHGVSPEIIRAAQDKGFIIKDATCLLVKKVHDIVVNLLNEDYSIVIFGAKNHPEVQGIMGWCENKATVIESAEEANNYPNKSKIGLVSQTTKDEKDFFAVAHALLSKTSELRVFNTICSATRKRQEAARELAEKVDLMLVIGDTKSSNTTTLYNECVDTGVKTYLIQTASDINEQWLEGVSKVGITAGASTPDWIIKEVFDKMTGYDENQMANSEESFAKLEAEMAEMESHSRGDIIKGTVIQVLDDEVMVDVGGKSEGIIPLKELSIQDINSCKEVVKVGDEIEVLVLKWDSDGTILLSKKKVDTSRALDKLEEDFKEGRLVNGTIIDVVKGGLLVDVGVVAFLPASHVDIGYVKNLEDYKGKNFDFKIIEFNRNKRRGSQIVVSRKGLVEEEKERLKKEFWDSVAEGQTRTGKVKRLVDYGAFIDLGGYEGLLHVSELDHHRIEHPADVLQEGQDIEVYILGVDREKQRVSLSRKALLKSPWDTIIENHKEGDIIEGTVVRIAPFGAFVELIPGVDGLVHISQLANYRVEKPEDVVKIGDKVSVKIISIDMEEKKIGLSIKQASEEAERKEVQDYLQNQEENN